MERAQDLPSVFPYNEQVQRGMDRGPVSGVNRFFPNPQRKLPSVSVIIPTLNEAQNLPYVLPYLPFNWINEVLLVDGRSTDGTVEVAKKILPSIKVVLEKKRGKGAALHAGYKAAKGDILIVMDADGSNDPREIPRFISALIEGADMVKGSRFAPGGGTTDMPLLRRLGNQFFTEGVNLLFGSSWTDLCYGYHAFWRYCLDLIYMADVPGFEIDTALYLGAIRQQLHIIEVPSFEGYRFCGEGKLQTIPDGWRVMKTILSEWNKKHSQEITQHFLGFRGLRPVAPAPSKGYPMAQLDRQLFQIINLFLNAGYSLTNLMGDVLQFALVSIEAVSGSIFLFDQTGSLDCGCLAFQQEVIEIKDCDQSEIAAQGLAGWVARNRQPVVIKNTLEDPRWLRRPWDEGEQHARSALSIPLVLNDQRVCVLTLVRPHEKQFTQADLEYFYHVPTARAA